MTKDSPLENLAGFPINGNNQEIVIAVGNRSRADGALPAKYRVRIIPINCKLMNNILNWKRLCISSKRAYRR